MSISLLEKLEGKTEEMEIDYDGIKIVFRTLSQKEYDEVTKINPRTDILGLDLNKIPILARAIVSIDGQKFEGFSEIVPIRATKDGIKNSGKEGLVAEQDFAQLQDVVFDKIKEACQNLMDGKIVAHPMKTRSQSACTYCQYKGICRFDTVFEDCKYNIVG